MTELSNRGRSVSRAANVRRARALRAEGLLLREIGERMEVSLKTVSTWLNDPDLAKQQSRRARYARPCEVCGHPTDGSGGYKTQRRICNDCRAWPDEAIIDAIKRWAKEHGRAPTCTDWQRAGDDHPCADIVGKRLGWNQALLRAGFGLRRDCRPETQQWVEEQIAAGRTCRSVAEELGVSPAAITERLRYRGLTVTDVRERAAA